MHAYHTHCLECATSKNICAKCHESNEEVQIVTPFSSLATKSSEREDFELEVKIKRLSERQRRTYYRKIENGDVEIANLILDSIHSDSDFESEVDE